MDDLMQDVWDKLRKNGHVLGDSYIQENGGQLIVVDGVAMSFREATAVAEERITVAEVARARGKQPNSPYTPPVKFKLPLTSRFEFRPVFT